MLGSRGAGRNKAICRTPVESPLPALPGARVATLDRPAVAKVSRQLLHGDVHFARSIPFWRISA